MSASWKLLGAVLTLICYILFGFLLKRKEVISHQGVQDINKLVFCFGFPVGIALGFYQIDIPGILNAPFFSYLMVMFVANIALAFLLGHLLHPKDLSRIATITAIFRGAFLVMGYPILDSLYGPQSIALTGIILALSQVLYNLVTTYLYEQQTSQKTKFHHIFLSVLTSPMVLGVFAGILINVTHINLFFLEKPLRAIANMSSPLALMVLGYGLELDMNREHLRNTALISVVKLLLLPFLAMVVAKYFALTPLERGVAIILFGSPSSINVYTFAKTYGGDEELAQDYVLATTLLYSFTIGLVLLLL